MSMRVLALVLSAMLLGCGDVPVSEGEAQAPLQTTEQAAGSCGPSLVCGFTCPSGTHPVSYTCSTACGGNGNCGFLETSANGVNCEPNTTAFYQCGTTCPTGMKLYASHYYKFCTPNSTSTVANRVLCGAY
jgi:hypothetical protein